MVSFRSRLARLNEIRLPFAWILPASMAGVILAVIILTGVLDIRQERNLFRQELEARGRLLADTLNNTLADPLYFLDVDKAEDFTTAMEMSQDALVYIQVFRPDGSLLIDTLAQTDPRGSFAVGLVESVIQNQEPVLEFDGENLEVTAPIMAGNQLVGIVHFDVSAASLNAHLTKIFWDQVWQGLALLAGASLLAFAVARFVTKPLQALRTAALSIGRGNLDEKVPVGGPEETASLGQALDRMRRELKGLYLGLERKVVERTVDLMKTNKELEVEIVERQRAETELRLQGAALRESEERFRDLYENSPIAYFSVAMDGRIHMVNRSGGQLLGYARKSLIGRSVIDLYADTPSGKEKASHLNQRIRAGEEIYNEEMEMSRADGTSVWISLTVRIISDVQGRFVERQAIVVDVSERKQAEEAQRRWAEENSVMAEIGRVISSSLDINEVYDRLGEEIRKLIPFDRMSLNLVNYESGTRSTTWVLGADVPGGREGGELPLAGSLAGEAVITKSPNMLEVETEADIEDRFPLLLASFRAGFRSFLTVPLFSRDVVIGVVRIQSKEKGIYSQPHLDLAQRVANQIAGAIANSQLYVELEQAEEAQRRWAEENSMMATIGRVMSSSLDVNEVYDRLGQEIRKFVPFDRMSLTLIDKERETISPPTWIMGTEVPGRRSGHEIPLDGTLAAEVIRTKSPIMLEADTAEDLPGRFNSLLPQLRSGLRSFLVAPLCYLDEVIGVLHLQSKQPGIYSQRQLDLAGRVANQIAGAIANSQLYAERKQLAEETSVMAEIGRVISSSLDINEVYDLLGETIRKAIPFDQFGMSVIDYENGTSSPIWALRNDGSGPYTAKEVPLAGAFTGDVVGTRSSMLLEVEDAADLENRYPPLMPAYNLGMRSFMAVPILGRDTVLAVLQIRSKELGLYSQRHLDLAERVGNQIAGAIANSQLYAERVRAEEAMRVSEGKYRTLVNQSPDMILVSRIDDFHFTEVNDRACEHYGYTREQLLAMNIFDLEVEPPLKEEVRSLYDNTPVGHVVEVYGTNKRKDGTTFPVHVRFAKLNDRLAMANVRDITEHKEAEERIKASLEEKEILLKEINHRVKNNLQIVSSLLNLGSRDIQDGQAQEMLNESQARIRAMALIHEKLYQSEDLARIDFGEYLWSLTSELRRSHGFSVQDIELKLDAGHTFLGVDTAIPCGLIVNEMVSNSFKHAFPSGSGGEISIALHLEGQEYSLAVRDNGVGFPEDFDIRRSDSLGLKLVNALVDQLGGTIELNRNGGAEINITFPAS